MKSRDTYRTEWGGKKIRSTFEEMIVLVRQRFPQAFKEGSTGPELSWWNGSNLVAHSWSNDWGVTWWTRFKT